VDSFFGVVPILNPNNFRVYYIFSDQMKSIPISASTRAFRFHYLRWFSRALSCLGT
jgi:hypothetical protein